MSWTDLEKRREYDRKWRAKHKDNIREKNRRYRIKHPDVIRAASNRYRLAHREEINEKAREARRNRPAQPGLKGRGRKNTGWLDAAYCTENLYAEEISWDIDKEKIRRSVEE